MASSNESSVKPKQASIRSFLRALAAAAIHPGLRSVMLFDADQSQLALAEAYVHGFLEQFLDVPVKQVSLTPYHRDDALWGLGLGLGRTQTSTGLLLAAREETCRLVTVRDLPGLGVDAMRAAVQMIDAPVVHVERRGQSLRSTPRLFWLATCARSRVGSLSDHLLDRFALRLHPPGWHGGPAARLRAAMTQQTVVPPQWEEAAQEVRRDIARLRSRMLSGGELPAPPTPYAIDEVIEALSGAPANGLRRQLSLGRLAVALARLDNAPLSRVQVSEAARLLGAQEPPQREVTYQPGRSPPADLPQSGQAAAAPNTTWTSSTAEDVQPPETLERLRARIKLARPGAIAEEVPNLFAGEAHTIAPVAVPTQEGASVKVDAEHVFPEDRAKPLREFASLRRISLGRQRSRGPAIGVRSTDRLDEVAAVPTLMAAAPFQALRRLHRPETRERFVILKRDLRAWRRPISPASLLVIVRDATAAPGLDDELEPFLRQAYVDRAQVHVVSVGERGAENELQATVHTTRGVLDPALEQALRESAGRATPLAHGLSLASLVAREHCHHGRRSLDRADVVVITDGLGNIPLSASLAGRLDQRVSSEGIEDALRVAGELARDRSINVFLIGPKRLRAPEVLENLSEALGATLVSGGEQAG